MQRVYVGRCQLNTSSKAMQKVTSDRRDITTGESLECREGCDSFLFVTLDRERVRENNGEVKEKMK